ncbi:MAG: NDP-sugar synthase [Acidobacteriota bacterium]|nr:NDP-sugar synthase [Acidobacteriota bacterium]
MRAFLLAAGRGIRFRPVTERIPKPLFPFLNVPLARSHLAQLREFGVSEAGVNLHHLGQEIEKNLVDGSPELPELRFFREPAILGTAGALANAADWLSGGDFLVVNSDAAIEPNYDALVRAHRKSGRLATLLVVPNREPDRYTPLQSEGDRVTAFGAGARPEPGGAGVESARSGGTEPAPPLLYTGVCVLSPRLLSRIGPGERALVDHLWNPLLVEGEEIGWAAHDGPFADLGRPRDFLRASFEALARGGPFPAGAGRFDEATRVLTRREIRAAAAADSVLGECELGEGARIAASAVWDGTAVGAGARVTRCLLAGGHVAPGAEFTDSLLWGARGEPSRAFPLT